MQPTATMHERLKTATRGDHDRLERRLDIMTRLADPQQRRLAMTRFWQLHVALEPTLSALLDTMEGLDYPARRKSAALAEDVAVLGGPVAEPKRPGDPLGAVSQGEALGLLYVLEGSTLGGLFIRREMAARGSPMVGLDYFAGYGALTGQRWRDFLAVLDREASRGPPQLRDEIVRGALRGFRYVEDRLCDGIPA